MPTNADAAGAIAGTSAKATPETIVLPPVSLVPTRGRSVNEEVAEERPFSGGCRGKEGKSDETDVI